MKHVEQRVGLKQSTTYQIKVEGRLDENWSDWFGGLTITIEQDDKHLAVTTLTGPIIDQTALHGILARIRNLGLPLLLVECMRNKEVTDIE